MASIAEVLAAQALVPELSGGYSASVYEARFAERRHLALVAFAANGEGLALGGEILGFKVGYEWDVATWYSWMGGVRPEARGRGVATALANAQEEWARQAGYERVRFKTWNAHRNMLVLGLRRGYSIVGWEAREEVAKHRIWLEKVL